RIVGEEADALAELRDRAELRREARVILRRAVGIGIERIVLRIEAVEVEAERGIERERAVEQADLVAEEDPAEHVVGFGKGAARIGFAGGRLDAVADALLVGPADVAAERYAVRDGAGVETRASLGREAPDAVLERIEAFAIGARRGADRRAVLVGALEVGAVLPVARDLGVLDRAGAAPGPVERQARALGLVVRGQPVDDTARARAGHERGAVARPD